MAIVHRRVFYAKVGMAGPLVEHLREFGKLMAKHGSSPKDRVLTDYMSGRTDRVVWEWEMSDLAEFAAVEAVMGSDAARDAFTQWERKMNDMIHYAEVENWALQ